MSTLTKTYRDVKFDEGSTTQFSGEYSRDGETWYGFAATMSLHHIHVACMDSDEAAERIWEHQDGYGSPGYYPAQGWDWSGIRDSSPNAIATMWSIAREYVSDAEILSELGLS